MHEGKRVALPELMAGYGAEHAVLLLVYESTQLVAKRWTDHAPAELLLCAAREPAPERDASLDPLTLVPEQPPDRTRAELLLVAERADHPRLVERRGGARRCISREQPTLVLRARGWWLHQHGRHAVASLAPTPEAFEAVEHLVVAVRAKGDQQRKLRTGLLTAWRYSRSQPLIVGLQPLDRHQAHCASNLVGPARAGRLPRRIRWVDCSDIRLGPAQHVTASSGSAGR